MIKIKILKHTMSTPSEMYISTMSCYVLARGLSIKFSVCLSSIGIGKQSGEVQEQ